MDLVQSHSSKLGKSARVAALFALVGPGMAGSALAADALAGKSLYLNGRTGAPSCASSACHTTSVSADPWAKSGANNVPVINYAIQNNYGGMAVLKGVLTTTELDNIAAFLANPNVTGGTPTVTVSATSLSFTATTVGSSSAASTVTVSNTGSAALTLTSFAISGAQAGSFTTTGTGSTCTAGGSVAVGGSCTIKVQFKPAAVGANAASLSIVHNATGSPTAVALSGTGTAAPVPTVALSATSVAMGSTVINTAAATKSVTVTNSGQAALSFSSLSIAGTNASSFTNTGTCSTTASVAAGGSCTLVIGFKPTTAGSQSATLTLQSNASNGAQSLALTGTGQTAAAPVLALSPTTQDLGSVTLSQSSALTRLTLTNSGTANASVTGVTVAAPFSAPASVVAGDCGTAPFTLAAGASCKLVVQFTPTAVGAASGTVSVTGTNVSAQAALTGTGASATVTPTPTDTGSSSGGGGGGGCTASTSGQDASLVALLLAAAGVGVWRRRTGRADAATRT